MMRLTAAIGMMTVIAAASFAAEKGGVYRLHSSDARSISQGSCVAIDMPDKRQHFLTVGHVIGGNMQVENDGRFFWLSGLRIGEAIGLTWDVWADGIRVDLSNEVGVLLIHAEDEKGGQDREYAMAPEFDAFLRVTPVSDRQGYVFNAELTKGVCRNPETISRKIAAVGAAAGVKVDEQQTRDKKTRKLETKIVWGSAHDLRRAFGLRWARRVMPMVLKELMRHKTVLTTEKYYVGIQAQETAKHLRKVIEAELADGKQRRRGGGDT